MEATEAAEILEKAADLYESGYFYAHATPGIEGES